MFNRQFTYIDQLDHFETCFLVLLGQVYNGFYYRSGLALLLRTDVSGSLLNVLGVQRDLSTKLLRA